MTRLLAGYLSVLMSVLGLGLAGPVWADPAEALTDLVDAAAQRLQTADPVAANKWLTGGPITDPARVQQVLATVSADAGSHGIATDYVTGVFTDQINATEGIEYSRFAWWKFDPSAAPTSAPDLSESRSVIDGLNHRMVSQIALQWPVLQSADCASALDAARTTVADARKFDDLYRQALAVATRSYCPAR